MHFYFYVRPKIITNDGNLIFEAGLNRNISFRLNGGNSRITINDDYDLLALLQQSKSGHLNDGSKTEWSKSDFNNYLEVIEDLKSLKKRVFGSTGLEYNIQLLRNRTTIVQQILTRYRNSVNNAEKRLQILFESLQKNNCRSNPCKNGGTCINLFNSFICKCSQQFEVRFLPNSINIFSQFDLICLDQ